MGQQPAVNCVSNADFQDKKLNDVPSFERLGALTAFYLSPGQVEGLGGAFRAVLDHMQGGARPSWRPLEAIKKAYGVLSLAASVDNYAGRVVEPDLMRLACFEPRFVFELEDDQLICQGANHAARFMVGEREVVGYLFEDFGRGQLDIVADLKRCLSRGEDFRRIVPYCFFGTEAARAETQLTYEKLDDCRVMVSAQIVEAWAKPERLVAGLVGNS